MKDLFHKIIRTLNFSGRDWTVFLLSLLLAFSIWLIHNLSLNYSTFMQIPVTAECNIQGHANKAINQEAVIVRCRTSGYNIIRAGLLNKGRPLEINFDRNVMRRKSGTEFYLTANDLKEYSHLIFGEDVVVEYFVSDTLFYTFPYEACKTVPVYPVLDLKFKPQYMSVGEITVQPDSVVIYGEPNYLENVDRIYTEPIKHHNVGADLHSVARLERPKGIRLSEDNVRIYMDVSRFVEITAKVHVSGRNVPSDKEFMVYPSVAEITFRCLFPFSKGSLDDVKFYVDYNDFVSSIGGKCIVHAEDLPSSVFSYTVQPQVFECVVNDR